MGETVQKMRDMSQTRLPTI